MALQNEDPSILDSYLQPSSGINKYLCRSLVISIRISGPLSGQVAEVLNARFL